MVIILASGARDSAGSMPTAGEEKFGILASGARDSAGSMPMSCKESFGVQTMLYRFHFCYVH